MDRIKSIRILGVRAIERMALGLSQSLTVLVGDNGTCKSTILACVELLRQVAEPGFEEQLDRGECDEVLATMYRRANQALHVAVTLEDDEGRLPAVDYGFSIMPQGYERRLLHEQPPERVLACLRRIRVAKHHALGIDPADAAHLAQAWSTLCMEEGDAWEHTMELVRLGLGERFDNVSLEGGASADDALRLVVHLKGVPEPLSASELSSGQRAWFSFVAMSRLERDVSLLALDDIEAHLHPALLGRAISLLSNMQGAPVLITTHSDHVLGQLDEPVDALRVCELEDGRVTLKQLDADKLGPWLERYEDLGQLRASGYLRRVHTLSSVLRVPNSLGTN